MPAFCAVLNCGDKYAHGESISFHKFPHKKKDLLEKWIEFTCRGPKWKPSKWSSICSHHFLPDDFSNLYSTCARKQLKKNAIPSVAPASVTSKAALKTVPLSDVASFNSEEEHENEEILLNRTTTSNIQKNNCRFCGICCRSVTTFATNFEIFGMIQKCFPTLNIQQDDNLPKDVCTGCLKRLKNFSQFIDKVLETQQDLQSKFLVEKTIRPPERQLKIKQEPVVKVKQEAGDSFLSDELDMAIDECDQDSCERKFPFFSDFPMLNAQDIINNCDIMEIINLDDPFIDIPDDDGTTIAAEHEIVTPISTKDTEKQRQMQMITDEHNYNIPMTETKDTLNIGNFYKTEKTEMHDENAELAIEEEVPTFPSATISDSCNNLITAQPKFITNSIEQNSKPIVTSVSAIAESRLQITPKQYGDKLVVTSISDLLPASNEFQTRPSVNYPNQTKPNIVVLNESIVKSGSAFQLYSCHLCHLQFFTQESLNNHISLVHTILTPMVSLPMENIPPESNSETNYARSFKSVYNLLRQKRKFQPQNNPRRTFISSCPRCEKFFVSKLSLRNHMNHICHAMSTRSQKKITNFKCRYCQKSTFTQWRVLRNHETNCRSNSEKQITQTKEHKCKVCSLVYPNQNSLVRHELHHKSNNQMDLFCFYCNGKFLSKQDLVLHYSKTGNECKSKAKGKGIAIVCRLCNKFFDSLQKIRRHRHLKKRSSKLSNKRVINSFECPKCEKIFTTSNSLAQHRITHSKEKRHKCELCSRVFKRRGGLNQHMKGFHMKLKPHECSVCKRSYALKADMTRCRHSLLKLP